jgi:hypothetical protein
MNKFVISLMSVLLLTGCGTMLSKLSPKSPTPQPVPMPAQVYMDLRNMVLTLDPSKIGAKQSPETPHVWGMLMEMGYSQAPVTLVSLADGTTSLYFGNGGGMIGGGEHEAIAQASKAFIATSEKYFQRMTPTRSFPLPAVGRVKFYILTFSGVYTVDVDENELGGGGHELSPLFASGQEVITQMRLWDEQRKK